MKDRQPDPGQVLDRPTLDKLTIDFRNDETPVDSAGKGRSDVFSHGDLASWLKSVMDQPDTPGDIGLFGDYRVQGILGKGGMGVVLKAIERKLERPVALKLVLPEIVGKPGARERFLREARAAAAVHHQRIVPIFAIGEFQGTPFLAMPLLNGQSLADRIKIGKKMSLEETLRIIREAAEGLAAAHAKGLIHRDIKPDNIWLEQVPEGSHVRLLDFGLARGESSGALTMEGAIVGTPQYMAPEQASGQSPDPKADLFSLGCVFYELLAGSRPFDGPSTIAVLNKIGSHIPTPLRNLDPGIPPLVSTLVERLLEKDPSQRLDSAEVLVQSIQSMETQWSHGSFDLPDSKIDKQIGNKKRNLFFVYSPILVSVFLCIAFVFYICISQNCNKLIGERKTENQIPNDNKYSINDEKILVNKFHIKIFQKKDENDSYDGGWIGEQSFGAKLGDQVTLDVELSKPAYAYLVAFRPDGVMELISPDGENLLPELSPKLRYPPEKELGQRYGLVEGKGLWVFALAASEQPLPAFSSWAVEKPESWGFHPARAGSVYFHDGSWIDLKSSTGTTRAKGETARDSSAPFFRVMRYFKEASKASFVAGWAFAVE